jgi:hypothetical protein
MSNPKDVHVVPRGGKWAAVRPGNDKASGVFPTQEQAVSQARQIAQNNHSELFVHGRNGQIRARDSFGNDPFPPKG